MGVDKSPVSDSSRCRICDSEKLATFLAEVCLHPPGLKNINRPSTFLFPEIALCLDCGVAHFTVDKDQLPALAKGFSTHA